MTDRHVFPLAHSPLGDVPFHSGFEFIERLAPDNFPQHLAVHRVDAATEGERYVEPHQHEVPEINLILADPGQELEYRFGVGDETYVVEAPAAVWVPPNTAHTAEVVKGSGYFVCVILASTREAFPAARSD